MAIKIHSTRDVAYNGVKLLVYGAAGAGKTRLNATLPNPIILSAESGLLSLKKYDLDYIHISDMDDLKDAYRWATESSEAGRYDSISLDSISEMAEAILNAEKKATKDPRQAYGAMQEQIADMIRAFRDIPEKHVYMSAKMEKSQNEMGRILYAPSMPGNKTGQALPYFFDEVLALRVEKSKDPDEEPPRFLQTRPDGAWEAKDRSGALDMYEEADLGMIIEKIQTEEAKPKKKKKAAPPPSKKSAAKLKGRKVEHEDEDDEDDIDWVDGDEE